MRNDGIATAGIAAGLSFGLLCISILGLFARVDDRLVLTYAETFANLASIRDLFLARANYTALYNPPRVDHVLFPLVPDKLEDLEDLQRRKLFQTAVFMPNATSSVPAIQESFLHQLMQTAWCTYGAYRTDILPARRNPGCQCISDAYLSLMLETQGLNGSLYQNTSAGNQTNSTKWPLVLINVSSDARQRAADKVYRCWDQRQVTRTRHCGKVCTTHVGSLALFANIILFLTCVSYLSYRTFNWNVYLVKAFIVFMGVLLSICYLVRDVEANSLTLGGLAVSLFYLTITLHTELSFTGEEDTRVGPHPLTTSLVVNLPLILSAHTIQIGVSGYGRDLWAFASFGVCGGLLGVVAQRLFWHSWYGLVMDGSKTFQLFVTRVALNVAYVGLQILLLLLFVAYFYYASPYLGGTWGLFALYQLYLTSLPWLLSKDFTLMSEKGEFTAKKDLTFLQMCVLFGTLVANGGMTVTAMIDLL